MAKLHLSIILDCSVDLNDLWGKIMGYNETHLGGANSKYTVAFNGNYEDGLTVLKLCLETGAVGKFYADFGA